MQTLECEAGHDWQREPQRGRPPKACPEHASDASRQAAQRHRTFYVAHPRPARPKPAPLTREQRSELARASALARWSAVGAAERSAAASAAALALHASLGHSKPVPVVERDCPYCGATMRGSRRRQCGRDECRKRFNAERSRGFMHERRARIRDNAWERFNPIDVYERDGWICGICSEPVDRLAIAPNPLSVSLDHIIPVSLGGPHTRANTRCSHLGCNSRRGNRVA